MEPTATSSFADRLRRFARWFFTFSPEAAADSAPTPGQQPARAGRHEVAQMHTQAQQTGRVEIFERKRP